MSLFGKKKEIGCGTIDTLDASATSTCCGEKIDGVCCIKILGSGCKNCHILYENAQNAVKSAGFNVEVEYIIDLQKIMEYGIMSMPALVINERVVSVGKVLKPEEIIWLIKG